MDRLGTLISYQWRAYWRRFMRSGRLTAGNQGLTLIVSGLVLVKYAQKLAVASRELSLHRTSLFEVLLGGIFFAWLLAFTSRDRSEDTPRFLALPLSLRELLFIRACSLLTPPYIWLLLCGSLAICYPTSFARRPLLGSVAAITFIAFSFACGFTISNLLGIQLWRRVLGISGLVLSAVSGFYLVRNPKALETDLPSFPPMRFVGIAATTERLSVALLMIALLAVFAAVGYWAALFSFKASLHLSSARNQRRKPLLDLRIPGALGGLIAKDIRYFRRLLDIYLALPVIGAGCFYLIAVETASLDIVIIFLAAIFLPNSPLAFDCLGLDRVQGLERYSLLALTGKSILISKNLAYVALLFVQTVPLIFLSAIRLGVTGGAFAFVTAISLACAYLAWGNWMSVNHPVKLNFFRFSSSTSSLLDGVAGVMFSTSPAVLIVFLLHSSPPYILLTPLTFGVLYAFSLVLAGKRFSRNTEKIARALS
jgi:hypothetical protein